MSNIMMRLLSKSSKASLVFLAITLLSTQTFAGATSQVLFTWDTEYLALPSYGQTYQDESIVYQTLPICSTLQEMKLRVSDCVESVQASQNGTEWTDGKLYEYVPTRWTGAGTVAFSKNLIDLPADESLGLINGSKSSLWRFKGIKHSSGSDFLLSITAFGVISNQKVDWGQGFIKGALYPVQTEKKGLTSNFDSAAELTSETRLRACTSSKDASICFTSQDFAKDLRFRLSLRLEKVNASLNSTSWIFARMESPLIVQSAPLKGHGQIFTIEGSPVEIQSPRILLPNEPTVMKDFCSSWLGSVNKLGPADSSNKTGAISGEEMIQRCVQVYSQGIGLQETGFGALSTNLFRGWEPFLKYAEPFQVASWSFSNPGFSLDVPTAEKLNACPKVDRIGGLVAGNATAVEPGPPKFNPKNSALEYRVAAPHFRKDGAKNVGSYSLFVSSNISRCLWGEGLAGASATVEITADNGTIQIATVLLKMDSAGLLFNVSGFHYSSGTISVRLSKTAVTGPKVATTSRKTISCSKGGVTKQVIGVAPKCPKGYVRKN